MQPGSRPQNGGDTKTCRPAPPRDSVASERSSSPTCSRSCASKRILTVKLTIDLSLPLTLLFRTPSLRLHCVQSSTEPRQFHRLLAVGPSGDHADLRARLALHKMQILLRQLGKIVDVGHTFGGRLPTF